MANDKNPTRVDLSSGNYEGNSLAMHEEGYGKVTQPMLRDKSKEDRNDREKVECGFASFRPHFLQRFNNLASFTFFCSLASLFSHALTAYISSQIPNLEKQFHLSSFQSGFIISCNEIGFLLTILIASHFAQKTHIPRFLTLCSIIFGLTTIGMFSTFVVRPETSWDSIDSSSNSENHFLYEELDFLCTDVKLNKSAELGRCIQKEKINYDKTHLAYAIFIILMIIQGMAKAPWSSLVPLYIDNNVSDQSKTGFYMGFIFCFELMGPGLAFGLGAIVSKIPVDLIDHGTNSNDPRWIGAWWIGFLVIGFSAVLSLPLVFFPKSLKNPDVMLRQAIEPKKYRESASELTLMAKLKALPKSLADVLKNPVYNICLLSNTILLLMVMGFFAFSAKYLEIVFLLSPLKANITMCVVSLISSAMGTLLGGTISSKMRLDVPKLITLKLIIMSVVLAADVISLFLGCDQPVLNNLPNSSESKELFKICHCEHNHYFPVCGSDGANYFSSCHAGCKQWINTTFTSCSAINGGKAKTGICEDGCGSLYMFITMFFVADLVMTIDIVPTYLIMIRTQYEKNKAVAMGFGSFVLSIFGFLPAPALFGQLIDTACSIWEYNCGQKGSCQLYDISKLKQLVFLPLLGGRLLSIALILVAFCLARKRSQPGDVLREKLAEAIASRNIETTSL
ncbi:solute carrier organic anion transporter family member 2A1 isoform X2 [Octopus bimaculoides]|nr:solute carrier organic anion transporter family member 2A1 isoform X2 [Octopus bimaculoides]|eukprot:XP_014783104.1 PREDICTED: solute carrier organic anion transporter family member 2A1-like isoform X2 [Octopus bimaculoides]